MSSKHKPNKYRLIKAVNFITVFFKRFLEDNDTKIYSTYNEGKSVVTEIFIRNLKNMIAASKIVYFVLDDIVDKYTNTYY